MDNKNRQDPGMKGNWQTIGMLIVAAILTFLVVGWMNSTVNARRRQELSYNEFVKMIDDGKVESISVGNSEISVQPKEGDPNYSQQIEYYVVRLEGDYQRCSAGGAQLRASLPVPHFPDEFHHEAHGRRRHHGRGKEQCQDVRSEGDRRDL